MIALDLCYCQISAFSENNPDGLDLDMYDPDCDPGNTYRSGCTTLYYTGTGTCLIIPCIDVYSHCFSFYVFYYNAVYSCIFSFAVLLTKSVKRTHRRRFFGNTIK